MDDLTEIIKSKDRVKLTEIILKRKEGLYKLAKAILKDERYVDDVVQEVMITAYFKIDSLKKAESFDSWLKRILINEAMKVIRKYKREILVGDEILSSICHIDTNLLNIEQKIDFKTKIKDLKEKDVITLILYYEERYTMKEIAMILNRKESTIKSRINRAEAKLKKFEREGGEIKWENKKSMMK